MRRLHLRHCLILPVFSLLFLTACGDSRDAERVLVRDSAGVTIIENSAPAWGVTRRWTADVEPVLSIGAIDGDHAYQLHAVAGLVRLTDGRIVVADGGSNELRFYSPSGEHLGSFGGRGTGPGEFTRLFGVYKLPGDSLLTFDPALGRVSLFDGHGRLVGIVEPRDTAMWRPRIYGIAPDGSIITFEPAERFSHMSLPSGFLRHRTRWIVRARDFIPLDTLGVFWGDEVINVRGSNFAAYIDAPFLRETHAAIRGGDIVVGEANGYELISIPFDGSGMTLIRRSHANRPLRQEEVERIRDTEDLDLRPLLQQVEFPTHYPDYAMVRADPDGYLWTKEYSSEPDAELEEWTIFSPTGEWLGTVELPRTTLVAEIGDDYVLATTRDELDVEYVKMFRLRR